MLDPEFENIALGEPGRVRWIHRSSDDLTSDHSWHFHPQYELTWFISSSGLRYVADTVEPYQAGDLVLSGANLPHCWRNAPGDKAEWISVQFDPIVCDGVLALPEAKAIGDILSAARSGLSFRDGAAAAVAPLLKEIGNLDGFLRILRLLEVLQLLAREKARGLASPDYHRRTVVDQALVQRLDRIMTYIAEHFRGPVRQADLATELGLTAPAFSKFVRAATGETFSGLVKLARINEACRLLANDDARVTDVALECGYQHTSHFNHHFLELKGTSPTDYRRQMRGLRRDGRKNRTSSGATAL